MRERRMHFTKCCSLLMQDLLAAKRDLRLSREIKRLGRFEEAEGVYPGGVYPLD